MTLAEKQPSASRDGTENFQLSLATNLVGRFGSKCLQAKGKTASSLGRGHFSAGGGLGPECWWPRVLCLCVFGTNSSATRKIRTCGVRMPNSLWQDFSISAQLTQELGCLHAFKFQH